MNITLHYTVLFPVKSLSTVINLFPDIIISINIHGTVLTVQCPDSPVQNFLQLGNNNFYNVTQRFVFCRSAADNSHNVDLREKC